MLCFFDSCIRGDVECVISMTKTCELRARSEVKAPIGEKPCGFLLTRNVAIRRDSHHEILDIFTCDLFFRLYVYCAIFQFVFFFLLLIVSDEPIVPEDDYETAMFEGGSRIKILVGECSFCDLVAIYFIGFPFFFFLIFFFKFSSKFQHR
jgi:hypothetical protein